MAGDEMKKVEERDPRRRCGMSKGRSKLFPLIYACFSSRLRRYLAPRFKSFYAKNKE
jgi:hypothetical protein